MKKFIYSVFCIILFLNLSCSSTTKEVSGELEQVFYVDKNNNILQVKLKGTSYEIINLSKLSGAPLPMSNLSVLFYNHKTHIFYNDSNNDVVELMAQTTKYTVYNLSFFLNDIQLNGKISALIRADNKFLYFRDNHNDIQVFSFGNDTNTLTNFSKNNEAPKSNSSPEVLSLKKGVKIFYSDIDNNIQAISTSNPPVLQNWTKLSKSKKTLANLGVMHVNDQEHVFFKGDTNEIEHIIYKNGKFRTDNWTKIANRWTQRANAPLIYGTPNATYINSQENIFYLDENKHLQNLVYENGKFKCYNWTLKGSLPECYSDPVTGKVMY